MKPILTCITGICCTILLATQAWALQPADGGPCDANADCPDGQVCEFADCPAIACDPDDPNCVQPDCPDEGTCVYSDNDGWESSCTTDADCPAGFECAVIGGVSEACAAGQDCPDAEPTLIYGCKAAACESDADCGGDLVCITYEVGCEDVAMGAPDCAGEDCPPPQEVPPCEPSTEGACGPKWAADCEAAADCGEGFQCVPEMVDGCASTPISSDGGMPSPDPAPEDGMDEDSQGDEDADDSGSEGGSGESKPFNPDEEGGENTDQEDCEPEETGAKVCELIEVACSTDADCSLEGWTCQANDAVVVVSVPCSADNPDCDPMPEPEEPVASEGMCVPPGWDNYGGDGPGASLADKDIENGTNTGTGNETPTGASEEAASTTSDDGGCNAGKSQGGLALALFALFLVVLTRRREMHQS